MPNCVQLKDLVGRCLCCSCSIQSRKCSKQIGLIDNNLNRG